MSLVLDVSSPGALCGSRDPVKDGDLFPADLVAAPCFP